MNGWLCWGQGDRKGHRVVQEKLEKQEKKQCLDWRVSGHWEQSREVSFRPATRRAEGLSALGELTGGREP